MSLKANIMAWVCVDTVGDTVGRVGQVARRQALLSKLARRDEGQDGLSFFLVFYGRPVVYLPDIFADAPLNPA